MSSTAPAASEDAVVADIRAFLQAYTQLHTITYPPTAVAATASPSVGTVAWLLARRDLAAVFSVAVSSADDSNAEAAGEALGIVLGTPAGVDAAVASSSSGTPMPEACAAVAELLSACLSSPAVRSGLRQRCARLVTRLVGLVGTRRGTDTADASASGLSSGEEALASALLSSAGVCDALLCSSADEDAAVADTGADAVTALVRALAVQAVEEPHVRSAAASAAHAAPVPVSCFTHALSSVHTRVTRALTAAVEGDVPASIVLVRLCAIVVNLVSPARPHASVPPQRAAVDELTARRLVAQGSVACVAAAALGSAVSLPGSECDGLVLDDVLTRMSLLPLLAQLAESPIGLQLLCEPRDGTCVAAKLAELAGVSSVVSSDDDMADPLLGTQALGVVGLVHAAACRADGDIAAFTRSLVVPGCFRLWQRACASGQDMPVITAAVIPVLAADTDAFAALVSPAHRSLLREWLETAVSSDEDARAATFNAVAAMLSRHGREPSLGPSCSVLVNSIGTFCGSPTADVFMKALLKPESDARTAALKALEAVLGAASESILRSLLSHAQLPIYLLDRSTEHSKEGKEAKFAVLRALAQNPEAVHLGDAFMSQVQRHVHEGPFFVKASAATVTHMSV